MVTAVSVVMVDSGNFAVEGIAGILDFAGNAKSISTATELACPVASSIAMPAEIGPLAQLKRI